MDRVVRASVVYTRDMGKARKTGRVCRPCAVRPVGGGGGGELDVAPSKKAMYMYLGPKKVPVEVPVVLKGEFVQALIQNEYYVKDDTKQLILCTFNNVGRGFLPPTYNLEKYNAFEITGIDWLSLENVPKNKIFPMQIYQLTDEILRACDEDDWRLQLMAKIICNKMVNSKEEKDINEEYLKMEKIWDDGDVDLRDVEKDFENTIKNNLNLDDEVDLSTKINGYEHAFETLIEKETQLHSTHKDDMDSMMKKIIKLKVDDIQGTSSGNSDFKQDVIKIIQDSRNAFILKIIDFNRDFDNVILRIVEEYRKTNSGNAHNEEPILTSLTPNGLYAYKNEETLLYCVNSVAQWQNVNRLAEIPPKYNVMKIKSATTGVDITTERIDIILTDDLKQNLTLINHELLKSIQKTDWRIILTAKTEIHQLFMSRNEPIGKLYSDASKLEQKMQQKQIKDLQTNIIIFAAKSDRTAKMKIADVPNAMSAVNIEALRAQGSETISNQVSAFEQVKLYALNSRIDYLQSEMVKRFEIKEIEDKIQGYITEWEPKISDYVAKYDDVISQVVEAWAKTAGTAAGDTGVGGGAEGEKPGGEGEEPGDDGEKPGDDGEKPGDDGEKPGDDGEKPGGDGEKPGDDGKKPGDDGEKPGDDGEKPGDNGEKPGDDGEVGSGGAGDGSGGTMLGVDGAGDGSPQSGTGTNVANSMSFEIDHNAGNVNKRSMQKKLDLWRSGGDAVYVYVNHLGYAGHDHYFQVTNANRNTVTIQKINGVTYGPSAKMDAKFETSKQYVHLKYAIKTITSNPASNTLASAPDVFSALTPPPGAARPSSPAATPSPAAVTTPPGGARTSATGAVPATPPDDVAPPGAISTVPSTPQDGAGSANMTLSQPGEGGKSDPSKLATIHLNTAAKRTLDNWGKIEPLLDAFRVFHNTEKDGSPLHGLAHGRPATYTDETDKVDDWKASFLDVTAPLWTTYMTYDNKVVAVCMCEKHQSEALKDNTLVIDKVYVTDTGQKLGLGLGTKVVKACLQEAHKTFAFTRIFAIVIYENETALSFFMKNFGMYFTLSDDFIEVEEAFKRPENKATRDAVKTTLTDPMNNWAKQFTKDKSELKADYVLEAGIEINEEANEMSFNGKPAQQRVNTILTIIKKYCNKRTSQRTNNINMAPTILERTNIIHALTLLKAFYLSTGKFPRISALSDEGQKNPLQAWNEDSDRNNDLEPLANWEPPGI